MPTETDAAAADVRVAPATADQEPIVANLLELYAHDFSEFHSLELGPDGRFGYKGLSSYWNEPGHHPFLVTVDGKLAGLALVKRVLSGAGDEPVWDMAEFFIVRGERRRGVGMEAAHQVWSRFPGRWQVRVMETNRPALKFWQEVIGEYIGASCQPGWIERNGREWFVFEFVSEPGCRSAEV